MRKITSLIINISLIFGLLISCNQSKMKIPDGILNPEELIPLLVDIHLIDGYLHQKRIVRQAKEDSAFNYYSSILLEHDISRPMFDSTILFYTQYPEEFAKIYDDVLEELSKMDGERRELEGAIIDSLE